LDWSGVVRVDHLAPFGTPASFTRISCPSSALCVGAQVGQQVAVSSHPGVESSWRSEVIDHAPGASTRDLTGISCPSVRLCVAVDGTGEVFTSSRPARASTWRSQQVDESPLTAVACPSSVLCVAVDRAGDVLTSHDPTGPARMWRARLVDQAATNASGTIGPLFVGISCPSARLCVGLDETGSVVVSADPGGRRPTWRFERLDNPFGLALPGVSGPAGGVSCVSTRLCVIASGLSIVTSTDPLGPASGWVASRVEPVPRLFEGVTCRSSTLCIAVDDVGDALTSTDPAGGASRWTSVQIDASRTLSPGVSGVACPTARLCVLADQLGNVATSRAPTGAGGGWRLESLPLGHDTIERLSCPSSSFCAGYDNAGNVLISARPRAGGRSWRVYHLDDAGLTSLTCLRGPFCFALDTAGQVLVSADPAGGAAGWVIGRIDPQRAASAISCASSRLCVVAEPDGVIATTAAPLGGASAWTFMSADTNVGPECGKYGTDEGCDPMLQSVACPTVSFCAASDASGGFVTSTNPGGSPPQWSTINVTGDFSFGYLSCPSAGFCVAFGDYANSLLVSNDPTGGAGAWRSVRVGGIAGLSCASLTLCVAYGAGTVSAPRSPSTPGSEWTTTRIDASQTIGVNCTAGGRCAATDPLGNVVTSADPASGPSSWSRTHIDPAALTTSACPSPRLCVVGDVYGNIVTGT
jgi:hypothetical protein